MLKANGLYGYIQNNNQKSLALVAGFLVIIQIMAAAVWALIELFITVPVTFADYLQRVLAVTTLTALPVLCGSIVWVIIALAYSTRIIRGLTGMQPANRFVEPRLFNMVENLAISCGMPMPQIEISETAARNAFAMGLSPESATIGVTRGLLKDLNDRELQAVLAHEFTHIRTQDMRLMTVATILCGIVFFVGWVLTYRIREVARKFKAGTLEPDRGLLQIGIALAVFVSLLLNNGNFDVLTVGLATSAALILMALGGAMALRLAVSRTREFVADAGACEMTKDPEALISALIKVEGRNLLPESDAMLRAMMISAPAQGSYATHPSLDMRIDAIVTYAAQRLNGLRLAPATERTLPTSVNAEGATGFSISSVKYPAWVSAPLIVIPALATGFLVYATTRIGLMGMLNQLLDLPNTVSKFWDAKTAYKEFSSSAKNLKNDGGFLSDFDLGDFKAYVLNILMFLPFFVLSRVLIKNGIGTNNALLRKMAGLPSAEMASDWADKDVPKLKKLYATMDAHAAQFTTLSETQAAPQQNWQTHKSEPATQSGAVVFGKRRA